MTFSGELRLGRGVCHAPAEGLVCACPAMGVVTMGVAAEHFVTEHVEAENVEAEHVVAEQRSDYPPAPRSILVPRDGVVCPRAMMAKVVTLKKRAEFLRLRGGQRSSVPSCVVETKPTPVEALALEGVAGATPRFGLTITKKIGGAVIRNRLRRRLRVILGRLDARQAQPGHDYVVVARPAAAALSFSDLARDVTEAFSRVHRASPRRRK